MEVFNEAYRLKEEGAILNWFDIDEPEGYFSLNDKMSDIITNPAGQSMFGQLMGGFTILRLITLAGGMMDMKMTKEQLLALNAQLNQIPKN